MNPAQVAGTALKDVVDAKHVERHLDEAKPEGVVNEAKAQVAFADRMLLLDDGKVAAEGTPAEVMTEETITEVYQWPVAIAPDPASGAPRITPLRPQPRTER